MIWAKIAQYALGIINTLTEWAKQSHDENNGAKVAVGEINKQVINEVQAVADARNDPANIKRVSEQSYRD